MTQTHITDKDAILSFMFAGNALFTLKSLKTNEHLTYRIKKKAVGAWHVLAGKEFDYIGDITPPNDIVVGSRFTYARLFIQRYGLRSNEKYVLPLKWFLHHLDSDQVEFWHEGRCGKCNRVLTDPVSIARGLGPECAQTKPYKLKPFKWTNEDLKEW